MTMEEILNHCKKKDNEDKVRKIFVGNNSSINFTMKLPADSTYKARAYNILSSIK
jgi:hypothetical protein